MKNLSLNIDEIYAYQQNRPPYLLMDHVDEVVPGVLANGYKILNEDEWFFKVHWPSDPNMPGMLQVEALVQMCALTILTLEGNKGKIVYLTSVDKVRLIKKIIPKTKLILKTKLINFKRGIGNGYGEGYVDNDLVCKASFTLILPELINKYKVAK